MLSCGKCSGRVFIDRSYCSYGHIELFCIRCGKRWESHKDSLEAKIFNRIETMRRYGDTIGNNSTLLLSK
jgi:hypothetical protein